MMQNKSYLVDLFFVSSETVVSSTSLNFIPLDLNQGAKGRYIHGIKILSESGEPITNLTVIIGPTATAPPGY